MQATQNLLTEKEVAVFLRVSREAITKFKRLPSDPLPYMKAGRRCLYDTKYVLAWAERNAKREQVRFCLRAEESIPAYLREE